MSEDRSAPEVITMSYHPDLIVWRFIRELVKVAQERGQEAGMTKHLVGAMLHLSSFPGAITDAPTDQKEGRIAPLGDYLLGDTVFAVIMAPLMPIYDQCREILDKGLQVCLLVPDKYFCGTRQNAEIILPGKIMVASIETFVCQNLERLAGFAKANMGQAIRRLLETYNERIKTQETGQSPLIRIPPNLTG
jgi:hypothetical protein